MFGVRHIRFDSMTYVLHYVNGHVKREGRGLAFFYFSPNSSIMAIPMGSNDLPFIFSESTFDYQMVSVQGQISYKIENPKLLADILDFVINHKGEYKKNDIENLNQRIINEAQTSIASLIHEMKLKQAIRSAKVIETKIIEVLKISPLIKMLGIDILGVNILMVSATPEMSRALETETREQLQQEADHAIYERRNFAVEQERKIKESELNTEILVEEKLKQIAEKKMQSQFEQAENDRKLKEIELATEIALENQRAQLIEQKSANDRKEADSRSYVNEVLLKPYKEMDWKVLMALSHQGSPALNIALAFRELAERADSIGQLNITPDLLQSVLAQDKERFRHGHGH
jgi:hypothetical protein